MVSFAGGSIKASEPRSFIWSRQKLHYDGGIIDKPAMPLTLPQVPGATSLQDIGYRAGFFQVLGVTATDAGSNLWVWSIQEDGGVSPSVSTVLEAPTDVLGAAAGPPISNSRLLFAYTRGVSRWGATVQRVTLAALGDDLSLGANCTRNSECASRVCETQLCCIQVGACAPADAGAPDAGGANDAGTSVDAGDFDAGPYDAGLIDGSVSDAGAGDGGTGSLEPDAGTVGQTPKRYAVGCSCDSSGGLVALLAIATHLRRRPFKLG